MSHLNLKFTKEEDEIWGKKIEATSTLVQGFPVETLVVKNLPANAGDTRDSGSIPGSEDPLGGQGKPPQYSCLESPGDGRAPQAGYSSGGHRASGTTEETEHTHTPPSELSELVT